MPTSGRSKDEETARGDVPLREAGLPETVVAARGDPGEVERGGARTANAGGGLRHAHEALHVVLEVVALAEGEARADEGAAHFGVFRDADAAVVEEGAFTLDGGEEFVLGDVVDDRDHGFAAAAKRDRDGVLRNAVNEVGGAVDRIDDPHPFALGVAHETAFFREDRVARIGARENVENGLFGGSVRGGHKVVFRLVVDRETVELLSGGGDFLSGAARGLDGGGNVRRSHGGANG